ncbi:helix-turn-helix domain-containing protein [Subtercola endophyticus]|uniref:helix-turn-helix domain-containing protein n=1 Tax=Subtercola endophyticus TaxID=2895559 RepID=UPI0036F3A7B6
MNVNLPPELEGRLTISVTEAAKVLGVSRDQAYLGVRTGEIPSLKIGARIVVPVAPLLRLLGVEPPEQGAE